MAYEKGKIEELMDGTIDWKSLHTMLSTPKDAERFEMYLEILQSRVPWDDKIVLPYGQHLYIVQKADTKKWVIKCTSGYEFCDWDDNWKLYAVVRVRDTAEDMDEIYPKLMSPHPEWQVLREYYCPKSGILLDVEAPTPWYPVIHDWQPDVDAFYKDWVNLPLPERSN